MERNKLRRCAIYTRKSSEEGLEGVTGALFKKPVNPAKLRVMLAQIRS